MKKIAVLASGGGSNLQALLDASAQGSLGGEVCGVFSNNPKAGALERARQAHVPVSSKDHRHCPKPEDLDEAILDFLKPMNPDWICNAGYLRWVTPVLLKPFAGRMLNIHPSLLPSFGGTGYYGIKVHKAVLEAGVKVTGATVHFVDAEYDKGPIVLQEAVEVREDDTAETLAHRVLKVEHRIYPRAVAWALQGRLRVEGRLCRVLPEKKEVPSP